jgi:hypothetical protein
MNIWEFLKSWGIPKSSMDWKPPKKEMDQSNSYNILGDEHAFCLFSKGSRVLTHTQIIPYIYDSDSYGSTVRLLTTMIYTYIYLYIYMKIAH